MRHFLLLFLREYMDKYNSNFKYDEMSITNIDDFIDENEKILWRDKPKKSAFIWSKILNMLPFALLWLLFDGFFIFMLIYNNVLEKIGTFFIILIVVLFLIHLTPFWIWLSNVITASIQHKNIEYAFTSKRIIIKSGIFIDIKNIYYIDVVSVNLSVRLIDRLLKVGDIYIKTNNGTVVLFDIVNPYLVLNQLQKIVNDIKTDMNFPNDLRPQKNSGYKTRYEDDSNKTSDKF